MTLKFEKETETLEFKKTTGELKEAVISVASILNKNGKGEVYFGIKNDGKVHRPSKRRRTPKLSFY